MKYACELPSDVTSQQRQKLTVIVERDARAAVTHLERSDDVTAVLFTARRSQVCRQLAADTTLVQLKD